MEELWNGFVLKKCQFEGYEGLVVFPKEGTANGHLALKTEYWDAFPEAIELDLLRSGFHLCFMQRINRWGTAMETDLKARFVRYVAGQYGLHQKVVPIGMSCGGLSAINFAARHPDLVSCLYLDAPVVNFMSFPCALGIARLGNPSEVLNELYNAIGVHSIPEVLRYPDMPLYHIGDLIYNRIPAVLIAGDSDQIVPFCENGALVQAAYEKTDIPFMVRIKPGCNHHPHGLTDHRQVLAFILANC